MGYLECMGATSGPPLDQLSTLCSMATALGDDLRRARRAAGLTQVQLAQVSKLDLATIQNLERGRGTISSLMAALAAINQRFAHQPRGTAFGEWLSAARRECKASQEALAKEAGISRPTLGQLERGRGNLRSFFCIAAVLGLQLVIRRDDSAGLTVGGGQPAIRYGTLCSGIEAVSEAWEPLGFQPVFFAETAAFPSAVLAHPVRITIKKALSPHWRTRQRSGQRGERPASPRCFADASVAHDV